MKLISRAAGSARRVAILPGAFNPPTLAHIAMAEAALGVVDEVLFVLPRTFPHDKDYSGRALEDRVRLVQAAIGGHPRFSLGLSEGGLFADIAREASEHYSAEMLLLCGRDAAERIVGWDYVTAPGIGEQLEQFQLLVASREGAYSPPEEIRDRVIHLALAPEMDMISSSEIRRRIAAGERWEELTPAAVAKLLTGL